MIRRLRPAGHRGEQDSRSPSKGHTVTTGWPTIGYRDFHDVPRAVVVEWQGVVYLLDCLLDDDADEYASTYTVYWLPDDLRERIDRISWTGLGHRGQRLGELPTSDVKFDATRRRAMNPAVLDQFGIGQ